MSTEQFTHGHLYGGKVSIYIELNRKKTASIRIQRNLSNSEFSLEADARSDRKGR